MEYKRKMIEHKFRDILEHDMDMLILEEFSCSTEFSKIFLSKVCIENATLCLTWQSKTDCELGESDMTVVFNCGSKKIALLIEDKIDAIAMPEQPSRYILRGDKGIADGEYDSYFVFIVAPQQYLDHNEKAKEYPNKVSYEEIKDYFEKNNDSRKSFKLAQINLAIEKQKNGYQVIKNAFVTDFWKRYIEYKNQYFPNLNLIVSNDVKPTNGVWTCFRTKDGKIVYHKSNKGYVDLTFNGCADRLEKIKKFIVHSIGNYYDQGYSIVLTGKSCAIRLTVPVINFLLPFEGQIYIVNQSFEAVKKLCDLSEKLDTLGISNILQRS